MCKLYLVNDRINSEAITDEFVCSGIQNTPLNERGNHILTAKIPYKKAEFQVKKSDSTVINVDEEQFVLDVKFKKSQYFAQLDVNNIVTNVIVADDEFISLQNGVWVESWSDGSKGHATKGSMYNATLDRFIGKSPFVSWTLNSTGFWIPPTSMPTDGNNYYWNEQTLSWVLI